MVSVEIGGSALGIGDVSVVSVDWYYEVAVYLSLSAQLVH